MKKLIYLLYSIPLLALFSCEDFLNLNPTNAASSENAINTATDAKVMINGIMRNMTSSSYYGRNFFLYGDAKGGDLTIVAQGRGNEALYAFNHSATSNSYSGYWSQIYYCLLQLNNLIVNIERIDVAGNGSAALTDYKAQALTLRALMYFDLVRLYGKSYTLDKGASLGVPMPLTVLNVYAQESRKTVAENYTQILKDLTDAAPLFANKNAAKGFVNYYTNKAISARVHLTMGNNAEALAAAEEIINDKKYSLYANDKWVASWSSEFGSESIFELGIYPDEADLGTASLGYYFMRSRKVPNAMGWFVASDYFIQRLAEDPTDIRKGIMDYDEISTTRFGACNKYTGNDNKGDKGSSSAVNIKVIRLSEIYLIAAEAAYATDKAKAAGYLNPIRKRAPALAPATETTVTLEMILNEKSKELYGEGQRYFDMLRLGRSIEFNDEIVGTISASIRPKVIDTKTFYKAILPIPKAELDANPALASQQNPEYQ